MRVFQELNSKPPKKKKCKQCKEFFEVNPKYPLQYVCKPLCAVLLAKKKREEKEKKDWNVKKKEMKIDTHSKEHKTALQKEVNKLARMIDAKFEYKCIDCGRSYGKQVDGAHFTSVGSNSSLRYHLDNIHSADSYCNNYSDKHHEGYRIGLEGRYGKEYLEFVEGLPLKYKQLKLSNQEVYEKLTIVRKLIRDFDTFKFENAISARDQMNSIIGIYK